MDTVTLVESQIEDGRRLLDRLSEEGVVVRAACWVKPAEDDRWSLYIAAPAVDEKGIASAYRQVYRVLRSLEDAWITDSDIKLVGESHPITQEVLDLRQRFPGRTPMLPRHPSFGGMLVDEIYAYPPGKVEIEIYGMTFRGEPGGALHLSFEPHNPNSKLTIESEGRHNEYPAETDINWCVAAPEGATLERSEIGRMELAWDLYGRRMRSSANEVWSFAKLGLHGFRFLREPN